MVLQYIVIQYSVALVQCDGMHAAVSSAVQSKRTRILGIGSWCVHRDKALYAVRNNLNCYPVRDHAHRLFELPQDMPVHQCTIVHCNTAESCCVYLISECMMFVMLLRPPLGS
jgi:hypothetical protein